MDRRTLLAFGLIGVIIFAMPYYFRWLNGEPLSPNPTDFGTNPDLAAPTQLAQPETRPSTPSLRSDPRPPQATQPPTIEQIETQVTSFEAQEVLVETDLYAAVFTTRGGRVTSWRLKEHLDGAGNPLELV